MATSSVSLPLSVDVQGKTWELYSVDYETADGKFSMYIYAISFEHASMILEEFKETAKISGKVEGVEKA